jgi:hypothetical protein
MFFGVKLFASSSQALITMHLFSAVLETCIAA